MLFAFYLFFAIILLVDYQPFAAVVSLKYFWGYCVSNPCYLNLEEEKNDTNTGCFKLRNTFFEYQKKR